MSTRAARLFAWLQGAAFYRDLHIAAANLIANSEKKTWLDAGCGPGLLTRIAAGKGYAAQGVDRDADMIAAARRIAGNRNSCAGFAVSDIETAIKTGKRFDVVSASSLLVVLPDPATSLRKLVSLTKPGGVVLVIEAGPAMSRSRPRRIWKTWGPGLHAAALGVCAVRTRAPGFDVRSNRTAHKPPPTSNWHGECVDSGENRVTQPMPQRQEKWVSVPCRDGFAMPSLLLTPRDHPACPGLLFIAEPFGINQEMKRVASEFAAAGYAVLVPDLLKRGSWFACVRALMADLKRGQGRGVDDLMDARAWLAGRPEVQPDRVAVMGLCMGGGFALILSKTGLFRVSAPFYGQTPEDLTGACPIVASFGARDRMIRPHAERLQQEVTRLGIPHDIKSYEGTGHSFMTRPPNIPMALIGPLMPARAGYQPHAARGATQRVLNFLERYL